MREHLEAKGLTTGNLSPAIVRMRLIKDEGEIALIIGKPRPLVKKYRVDDLLPALENAMAPLEPPKSALFDMRSRPVLVGPVCAVRPSPSVSRASFGNRSSNPPSSMSMSSVRAW